MKSLKSQVGVSAGPYREEITLERVQAFCKAIGVEVSSVAPPTFFTLFRKGEFDLFQKMGLELSKVLHAEQEYQYLHDIHAGDTVSFETTVNHVLEKQSSTASLHFVTFETRFQVKRASEKEEFLAGTGKTTIVVRERV